MAEGLKVPPITQREFTTKDHIQAERMARYLGYSQYTYTSTSSFWGLFCLPENPAHTHRDSDTKHPPYTGGTILATEEFGLLFVQDTEDLRFEE